MAVADHDIDDDSDSERRFAPAWCHYRLLRPILCFFIGCGAPPEMTRRQWAVVSAVSVGGFFSNFDEDLLPFCLRQLQESLGISEAEVGFVLSVISMGRAGAAVTSVAADIVGRRIVFFGSIVIFSTLSVLTAMQTSAGAFVALQLVARIFVAGKDSTAGVYLVEETDAGVRGWVMGMHSSVAILGGAAACILFGIVGTVQDGWRYLYGLAALQLFFLLPLWRLLPAKAKGQKPAAPPDVDSTASPIATILPVWSPDSAQPSRQHLQDSRRPRQPRHRYALADSAQGWRQRLCTMLRTSVEPIRLLATSYPLRASSCLFVSFVNGFAYAPAGTLKFKHLQEERGLSPAYVSMLSIFSGAVALVVFPLLGRLSDRGGRRTLLCCFMTACPLGVMAFYNAPGLLYLPVYFIQMLAGFGLGVLSATFFSEAFPASHRCTACGAMMLFGVLGSAAGLAAESLLYARFGSHTMSVSMALLPSFMSPFIVRLTMPETAGLDLEEIAPEVAERPAAAPAPGGGAVGEVVGARAETTPVGSGEDIEELPLTQCRSEPTSPIPPAARPLDNSDDDTFGV